MKRRGTLNGKLQLRENFHLKRTSIASPKFSVSWIHTHSTETSLCWFNDMST